MVPCFVLILFVGSFGTGDVLKSGDAFLRWDDGFGNILFFVGAVEDDGELQFVFINEFERRYIRHNASEIVFCEQNGLRFDLGEKINSRLAKSENPIKFTFFDMPHTHTGRVAQATQDCILQSKQMREKEMMFIEEEKAKQKKEDAKARFLTMSTYTILLLMFIFFVWVSFFPPDHLPLVRVGCFWC